ncbi:FecCD family ABC transporter permease [Marinobacter sp. SS21]|uniref:FecCD family ABC transporter permease n=1 Tax=Marinobacter sp. SS21 TaxID=2979460 RepID=UPI00232EC2FD|nr:iron ABC transporter permease [Marinobacter sp. SS21]MDC0661657.1 iron ABC transporter permease [Marinobacter sp. SS21]
MAAEQAVAWVRWSGWGLVVLAGSLVLVLASLSLGVVPVAVSAIVEVLLGEQGGLSRILVWELRLPRTLLGLLVGANLAVAGTLMQAVTRNPLASPSLTGVMAGGALAVVVAMSYSSWPVTVTPYVALVGGLAGAAASIGLAWNGQLAPVRLALAGVAVTALCGAVVTAVLLNVGSSADELFFWMAGGLLGRSWPQLELIGATSLLGLLLALAFRRQLNLLSLGDEVVRSLGMRVWRWRLGLAALAVFLTAQVVAVAGPIGFVGLVIPHLARILVGDDQRRLLPVAACLGAWLMVVADVAARTLVAPAELPVGLFTATLGGAGFIALIYRQRL